MRKHKLFILSAIVLVAALSSCTKVEDAVIGQWESELMTSSDNITIMWTFNSDGTLVREYTNTSAGLSEVDDCTYTVDKKLLKTYIIIQGSSDFLLYSEVDGKWEVDLMNDEMLKIRRTDRSTGDEEETDAAYLVREFVKKN